MDVEFNITDFNSTNIIINNLTECNVGTNTTKWDRVGSCDTFTTHESKDTQIEDLEEMLTDLISGAKTLSDLPDDLLKFSDEITRLPRKPKKPADWECCGSGCCPCIWDSYDRDLEIHERSVQACAEKMASGRIEPQM
jgi:hypothetical protein